GVRRAWPAIRRAASCTSSRVGIRSEAVMSSPWVWLETNEPAQGRLVAGVDQLTSVRSVVATEEAHQVEQVREQHDDVREQRHRDVHRIRIAVMDHPAGVVED